MYKKELKRELVENNSLQYLIKIFFIVSIGIGGSNCSSNVPQKFWLGPNYRGTHSTSRGLGSLMKSFEFANHAILKYEENPKKIFESMFEREKKKFHVLELGCGEGRALGQFVAEYSRMYNTNFNATCFNLKGYKKVQRGIPISGAVSSEQPREIQKMLDHYGIFLKPGINIPRVILGDASKSPWPFARDTFSLILSQAALSKIPELEIVLGEAIRTLKPGGFAALGLGGTHKCDKQFFMLPVEERQPFCGKIDINGQSAFVALTLVSPFDNLNEEEKTIWFEKYMNSYSGGLQTTILISKLSSKLPSYISCPHFEKQGIVELALRSCHKYTPAWDRGFKRVADFFNTLRQYN